MKRLVGSVLFAASVVAGISGTVGVGSASAGPVADGQCRPGAYPPQEGCETLEACHQKYGVDCRLADDGLFYPQGRQGAARRLSLAAVDGRLQG
ncbi:hypothetical protein AB0L57_17755 [Nocardia sp. NPDC052254]|uniref:hypothetical protein n=1 Tax=Nocardia sp. NPDC052254 TaxID=3155681 RepID=UPI0034276342